MQGRGQGFEPPHLHRVVEGGAGRQKKRTEDCGELRRAKRSSEKNRTGVSKAARRESRVGLSKEIELRGSVWSQRKRWRYTEPVNR